MKRYDNNLLGTKQYYIDRELQDALQLECFDVDTSSKNNIFYIVVFRILNKEKKDLVYSYISYNTLFYRAFVKFLIGKANSISEFKEPGYFLTLLDEEFLVKHNIWSSTNSRLILSLDSPNIGEILNSIDSYIKGGNRPIDSLLSIIERLVYIANYDNMYKILDRAVNRNYNEYIKEFLDSLDPNLYDYFTRVMYNNNYETNSINPSLIHSCVFIVKDKDKLINKISSDERYGNINPGPQKYRGELNSATNFLSVLDKDFRENLYFHNLYYTRGNIAHPYAYKLDRKKFSFNNIHMNLGSVRWYSSHSQTKIIKQKTQKFYKPISINNLKSLTEDSIIYKRLEILISKSPINYETQLKIEEFLLDFHYVSIDSNKDVPIDYTLINKNLTELLISKKHTLIKVVNNFKELQLENKKLISRSNEKTKSRHYLSIILKQVDNDVFVSIIYGRLMRIITYYNKYNSTRHNIMLDIFHNILEHLIREFYYNLYSKLKATKENFTLFEWKADNRDLIEIFEDNTLKTNIGGIIVDWIIESNLVQSKTIILGTKEKHNIIIPSNEILNTIEDQDTKLMHLPLKIPMIVKPKPYYRDIINNKIVERLGGYLLNDIKTTNHLLIDKWNLKECSKIQDENVVYDLVNNMSGIGYKINRDVLNFIYVYGVKYGLIIDKSIENPLHTKSKLTKAEFITLESYLSKIELQENILGLANVFTNVHEFYIPVRLDFRGRMNCISEYLNYQSNELAKSLLLFSKAEKIVKTDIIAISYLKAYGANCFGNKLDKKSWNERVKWVDNNSDNIINFINGKLISQADNKLLFLAFCVEYTKWIECMSNNDITYFNTHLPIQLDATCNGYQHLSMLSSDNQLAKELNLIESNWSDEPRDLYTYVSVNMKNYYKEQLKLPSLTEEQVDTYTRLSNMSIPRSVVKNPIMTSAYNASTLRLIKYIEESFIECEYNEPNQENKWYQYKEDPSIKVRFKDFTVMVLTLKKILDENFTNLKYLLKYLNEIARICSILSLSIPWLSPSGIIVIQGYLIHKEIRLSPFTYSKKTLNLRIPDKKGGILNKRKQIRSFMPNLVHSLDAGSLALLVDLYFNDKASKINNIYSVHDCFAVTANNIDILMELLKHVYNKIYSQDTYLKKLDKYVKNHIRNHYGDESLNEETLKITIPHMKDMTFPDIEKVLGTKLSTNFLSSSYIIN